MIQTPYVVVNSLSVCIASTNVKHITNNTLFTGTPGTVRMRWFNLEKSLRYTTQKKYWRSVKDNAMS